MPGFIKINTDAAVCSVDGKEASGGLVRARDHNSQLIVRFSANIVCSVVAAELWVHNGLTIAWDRGFIRMEIAEFFNLVWRLILKL